MRNITPEMLAEFTSKSVNPVFLAELFFDSGTLRLWTGYGELVFNGETFFGGGNMIGISQIQETQQLEANGIVCTLSGIPQNLIALSLAERSRGRPFRLYLGGATSTRYIATEDTPGRIELEDSSGYILLENQLINAPKRIFSGLMDVIEITDGGDTSNLRLSVENILIMGRRSKVRRYTSEDQKRFYPNDKGLDLINQLQDKEIVW